MAAIAVVALVAGSIAVVQRSRADSSATEADLRRVMAESQVAVGEDPNRAMLLALEAHRLAPSTETLGSVQSAVTGARTDWLGDIANGKGYRRVAFITEEALVASSEQSIEVWDTIDRVMLRERAIGGSITDIDVSADREFVAAASADGSWTILDSANLEQITGGVTDRGITVIRIDVDHGIVALGLDNGRVQIEQIDGPGPATTLQPAAENDPVAEAVTDISLSPDGRRVAAAWGNGHTAQQWDLQTGSTVGEALSRNRHAQLVLYADDVLYTAADRLQSFDPDSGEPIGEAHQIAGGVDGDMRMVANESGLRIVGLGSVWSLDGGGANSPPIFYESVSTAFGGALSPDGGLLVFGTTNGLSFWAPDGVGLFIDAKVPAGADSRQFNAISTDGHTVVQGGNIRDEVPTSVWTLTEAGPLLVGDFGSGRGVRQFGTDVITFEAIDDGLSFELWNAATASLEPLMIADFMTFGVNIPALTPDRRQFLHPWNGGEGILDVYDVASGRLLHRLRDVEDTAPPLTSHSNVPEFSSDGLRLVYPTASEYVAVYDADTWALVDLLDPSVGFAHLVFTPDGAHAITLSSRGLEIRDAADLRTVVLGPVPSVDDPSLGRVLEITAGGGYLKTGGLKGAQLWDAATLDPIGRPFPHDRDAWAATLAAETDQLATVVDGATVIWRIDLENWLELSCFAVGRNLTRQEWAEFGPRGDYHATCDNWPEG